MPVRLPRPPEGLRAAVALLALTMLFPAADCAAAVSVAGSGSSLLNGLMANWMSRYNATDVALTYDPIGSGSGLRDIQANTTWFAGSEALLDEAAYVSKPGLMMLPVVSVPVAIVYNLPGLVGLQLTRQVTAKIFSRDIRWWDDTEIKIANSNLDLPHKPIEVVVRQESSGTSFVMTSTLTSFGWLSTEGCRGKACGTTKTMMSVGFGDGYTGKSGSTGLAQYIKSKPYALGYVGVSSAIENAVPFAIMENKAGDMTVANRQYTEFAIASSKFDTLRMTSSVHDRVGYPVLGNAYLVYWRTFTTNSPQGCDAYFKTVDFLYWIFTSPVSEKVIRNTSFVANRPRITNRILGKLWGSTCNGQAWDKKQGNELQVEVHDAGVEAILHVLGYHHHQETGNVVVPTQDPTGPSLVQVSNYNAAVASPEYTWMPLWAKSIVIVYSFNNKGLNVALSLSLRTIRMILFGQIKEWTDPIIAKTSSFVPFPDRPIELVGHSSLYTNILRYLQVDEAMWARTSLANRVGTHLTSAHNAAEFTVFNGGISVVPDDVAEQWHLPRIDPIPKSGTTGLRVSDKGYPFVMRVSVGVRPAYDAHTDAETQDVLRALEFVRWLTSATPYQVEHTEQSDRESSPQVMGASGVEEDVLKNVLSANAFFRAVTLNGKPVYPAPAVPSASSAFGPWVIAVVTIVPVIGLITYFFTTRHHRKIARAARWAPRDSDNIAFVFTDILRSSDLWSAHPDAMKEALATHNKLIRSLIECFHGYEVKTIGDSFMVAFSVPYDAVAFVLQMQAMLLRADWPAGILQHDAAREDGDAWRGLRVRAGVHYGKAEVVRTSGGGYDYQGNSVNLCARVSDSANGGQVIITEETYKQIEDSLDRLPVATDVKYLGFYNYRGISESVCCLQVMPEELAEERRFGALRNATPRPEDMPDLERTSSALSIGSMDMCDRRDVTNATQVLRKWVGRTGLPVDVFAQMLVSAVEAKAVPAELFYRALATIATKAKTAEVGRGVPNLESSKKGSDKETHRRTDSTFISGRVSSGAGSKIVPMSYGVEDKGSRASGARGSGLEQDNMVVRWNLLFDVMRLMPKRSIVTFALHVKEKEKDGTAYGMMATSRTDLRGSRAGSDGVQLLAP